MFGNGTQTSNDDPVMLDNVKQLASQPADQVEPAHPASNATIPLPDPLPVDDQANDDQPPVTAATARAEPAEGFSSSPMPMTAYVDPINSEENSTEVETPAVEEPRSLDSSALLSDFTASADINSSMTPPPDPVPATSDETPLQETPQITSASGPADTTTSAIDNSSPEQSNPVDRDQMANMKQEALAHLEPLTDHLGGSPEETFKTTMMMIQANDNHSLIQKALDAAKEIEDDKIRAQAMLDIVNEINYFCQVKTEE